MAYGLTIQRRFDYNLQSVRNGQESVSGIKWNRCPVSPGTGVRNAPEYAIRQAFEAFGQVTSSKVIKDKYTGQSKAFAFVEMPVESQAHTAIKSLNGKEIMGKQIIVQQAHDSAGMGRQGGRMDYSKSKDRY